MQKPPYRGLLFLRINAYTTSYSSIFMLEIFFLSPFFFLLGSAIGSFLNVVTLRVPKRQSVVRKRSHCPKCKHDLSVLDLIPVFSFLFLIGRCRYCGKKISRQYPLVEAATGILFLAGFLVFGLTISLLLFLIYVSFLVAIFVFDYTSYIIPDFLSIPLFLTGIGGSLLVAFAGGFALTLDSVSAVLSNLGIAVLIGGGFFLLQFLLSRGQWVGGGDIRLGAAMGAMLGFPVIIAALGVAYIVGAVWSMGLMALRRKTIKDAVPFGAFLVPATILCLLWGEEIVRGYMKFIGF